MLAFAIGLLVAVNAVIATAVVVVRMHHRIDLRQRTARASRTHIHAKPASTGQRYEGATLAEREAWLDKIGVQPNAYTAYRLAREREASQANQNQSVSPQNILGMANNATPDSVYGLEMLSPGDQWTPIVGNGMTFRTREKADEMRTRLSVAQQQAKFRVATLGVSHQ